MVNVNIAVPDGNADYTQLIFAETLLSKINELKQELSYRHHKSISITSDTVDFITNKLEEILYNNINWINCNHFPLMRNYSGIYYYQNEQYIVDISLSHTELTIRIIGKNLKNIELLYKEVFAFVDNLNKKEDNVIYINSDYFDTHHNSLSLMLHAIPTLNWSNISRNYSNNIDENFNKIIKNYTIEDGKIIIWHGRPGTGKTWAIKSLLTALKDEFAIHYITDPQIFWDYPRYYHSVISANVNVDKCLFILEDSADCLISASRIDRGQTISRILNLTDGLLSQSRKDLFLITFNEKLQELDEAVVRPGRCKQILEFKSFNREQATEWLGHEPNIDKNEFTLADLYAIKNGSIIENKTPETKKVGF